jgi:2'-hydroxyisoflavone reductase
MTSRREFVKESLAAGALLAGFRPDVASTASRTTAPMRLLILGGTGFIGPHLVRHAIARGHQVTIFTRGRRDGGLPAGVERLVGDRNGQLQALERGTWDAVIDDSATNPDWVRASTVLLKDRVGRYLFTSSTGVYYPYLQKGLDEKATVRSAFTDANDASEAFGVRKAQCEAITRDTFGDRGLVVRPTYIVGPGDTTDRFPYWPQRLAQGGDTLAPGRMDDPVQIIDVRDLAEFMVRLVEDRRSGIYNAAGPGQTLTFAAFLDVAMRATDSTSRLTWVDDYAFLKAHGIEESVPWIMLQGNDVGHTSISIRKAVEAGLGFRPLADTVQDTLAWWPTVPAERRAKPRFVISPEIEAKALADWRAR